MFSGSSNIIFIKTYVGFLTNACCSYRLRFLYIYYTPYLNKCQMQSFNKYITTTEGFSTQKCTRFKRDYERRGNRRKGYLWQDIRKLLKQVVYQPPQNPLLISTGRDLVPFNHGINIIYGCLFFGYIVIVFNL
jgi:hypothetical protein